MLATTTTTTKKIKPENVCLLSIMLYDSISGAIISTTTKKEIKPIFAVVIA